MCAADFWKSIESYAKANEEFFRSFLYLPNGIPSEDTFSPVLWSIDNYKFESCFVC